MTHEDLTNSFSLAAKVIIELLKEVDQLREKFGNNSALVQKKAEQVVKLQRFYDDAGEAIKSYTRALSFATINNNAMQMVIAKYETGLSFEKLAEINAFDRVKAKDLDAVYDFWKKQKEEIDKITKPKDAAKNG